VGKCGVIKKLLASLPGFAGCLTILYFGVSAIGALGSAETEIRRPLLVFGGATLAYAISGLLLIGIAWRRPRPTLHLLAAALGILAISVWIFSSLDCGIVSGLEWASVIALAVVAFFVWLSVRLLSR
jgi:hypothetical protein